MIRVPFRFALLGVALALIAGVIAAPLAWSSLTTSADRAHAQTGATGTATDMPTATPTATPAPTQTPIIWTATPLPATQTPIIWTATPAPATATAAPTATPLPVGWAPDSCHPNHSLQQPCALATETDIGNLNFVGGSPDVYSFLLKGGREYRIAANVTDTGLDPAMQVFAAGQIDKPITLNDDAVIGNASAAVTVTTSTDAWYLVQVENKAPGDVRGKTYTLSARSIGAAPGTSAATASNPDDLVGNAYDVAHAFTIVWAVPYDLSMVCPDSRPGACYAGRHTFLKVPVKAGVAFSAVTYDLGAGVDTVLTLYKPDATQIGEAPGVIPGWRSIAGNDDIAAGFTLRSRVTVTPDWTGEALLVVAPSERQDLPPMPGTDRPGRYRLIVGPPEMKAVAAALAAQSDLPATPTPAAAANGDAGAAVPAGGASAPAAPAASAAPAEVIKEASVTGIAELNQDADLYAAAPPQPGDKLVSYTKGTQVKLLGQSYRGWVKVQPADSVTPGWMWGPSLKAVEVAGGLPANSQSNTAGTQATPTSAAVEATPPPAGSTAQPGARAAMIEVLDPAPLPTQEAARPVARQLAVEVCTGTEKDSRTCLAPIIGVRVELRLASTQAVQVQGVTDASGKVTLSTSVPSGTRLWVVVPALGIAAPVSDDAANLPIRVPSSPGGAK